MLQGFTNTRQISFPDGIGEQAKKKMVGSMVPPPFAKQLCLAATAPLRFAAAAAYHALRWMSEPYDEQNREMEAAAVHVLGVHQPRAEAQVLEEELEQHRTVVVRVVHVL